MSYAHYDQSMSICHLAGDALKVRPDFYSIIMAAMRLADTENLDKLKAAWPKVWQEYVLRNNSPAGCVSTDEAKMYTEIEEKVLSTLESRFPMEGFPYG